MWQSSRTERLSALAASDRSPPFSDFLWPEIPFSRKQRNRLRRLWPQDEMLPTLFGGTGQKCAHPPIRADGVNMRQVRGFGVGEPIRWAPNENSKLVKPVMVEARYEA